MFKQRDSVLWLKANGLLRHAIVRSNNLLNLNNLVLLEYPKSGGTWLGQMISQACNIRFPRNSFPHFRNCILHGHYLSSVGIDKPLIMWRDGRDVAVSFYFHCLFPNDRNNYLLVEKTRKNLNFKDPNNIRDNLPVFMNYLYDKKEHPAFSWAEFVSVWSERPAYSTSYETLRKEPLLELQRLLTEMSLDFNEESLINSIEDYSFEVVSKRKVGSENKHSFLRKGVVGDWRNNFTKESAILFDQLAGRELIVLGYEDDNSWVNEI